MTTVLPDRLERFMQPEFKLRKGSGRGVNGHADVCVMQAVAWLAGGADFTDTPDCACPVITRYCIRLNDSALFAREHRQLLKPYAPRIVGTRSTPEIHKRRSLIATDYAVRVFAPIRLRAANREAWAAELELLAPITNATSSLAAKVATARIRDAAAAHAAANAAAYAAAAAAADAAADADAAAYAAAHAAADAAAYAAAHAAAAADAAADGMRAKALECLDAMINCVEVPA